MFWFFGFICIIILYAVVENTIDEYNNSWWSSHKNKNFAFKWKGKTLWYSRSVAVALFTYCKNELGEWCVLANQRGNGTPDYQGYWNCVCGYLDFNENSVQAVQRECEEETGLKLPIENIEIVKVNSEPTTNRQNVTIHHRAILNGTTNDWKNFNLSKMENDEVISVKWIPIKDVEKYEWAFRHENLIMEYLPKD